jgi:hypothetical protein
MPTRSLYLRHNRRDKDGAYIQIAKFNTDEDPLESYAIRMDFKGDMICNCPAGKPDCRHKRMLPIFDRADRGQDELYNKVTENGAYQAYLSFDGKMFNWVKGPEKLEV